MSSFLMHEALNRITLHIRSNGYDSSDKSMDMVLQQINTQTSFNNEFKHKRYCTGAAILGINKVIARAIEQENSVSSSIIHFYIKSI